MIGDIIVIAVLAVITGLIVRSLHKDRKGATRRCSGNCSRCTGCYKI